MTFGSSYRKFREIEGSRNRDCNVKRNKKSFTRTQKTRSNENQCCWCETVKLISVVAYISAPVHLECIILIRRKGIQERWEDTFGESKTAMAKVQQKNALDGPLLIGS